jgi:hypothetical protein
MVIGRARSLSADHSSTPHTAQNSRESSYNMNQQCRHPAFTNSPAAAAGRLPSDPSTPFLSKTPAAPPRPRRQSGTVGRTPGRPPTKGVGSGCGAAAPGTGRKPGRMSGRKPGRMSGRMPGRKPGRMSGRKPGRMSGRMPGRKPGRMSGTGASAACTAGLRTRHTVWTQQEL